MPRTESDILNALNLSDSEPVHVVRIDSQRKVTFLENSTNTDSAPWQAVYDTFQLLKLHRLPSEHVHWKGEKQSVLAFKTESGVIAMTYASSQMTQFLELFDIEKVNLTTQGNAL